MANLILWASVNIDNIPTRTVACYQLASWLRSHGYTVKVIDFCHLMSSENLAEITEKYIDSDTLAIGVSATFWHRITRTTSAEVIESEPVWVSDARKILDTRIKLPWLLGGYVSSLTILKLDWIRFLGQSEDSLLKWMDENSSKLVRRDLFDVRNISKSLVADDFVQPFEVIPIELGRGCQFKCKFCSYPLIGKKKGTYLRDFDLLKDEFIRNYEEWGTTKYYFQDDTVNESEEKVRALADIAQSLPFKLEWTGYNRLDLIWSRPDTIQLLKDSGMRSAFFGIESFHPVASAAVGKGWNGKHAKDFLLKLREEWKDAITWHLSFIVGLPGEDRNSIKETQQWCIDNEMYSWAFQPLTINRNPNNIYKSQFEKEYEKYGYSFLDNMSDDNWKNDLWTADEAKRLVDEITAIDEKYQKPAGFLLSSLASSGYTYDELIHKFKKDIDWADYRIRKFSTIKNYTDFQLR
jgi:radical SAM superfamily enzyme YgiQ (UPF0313 family)